MKYCPECGIDNIDNAAFCKGCGIKIADNIVTNNQPMNEVTNENTMPQYYGQPYQYPPQPTSRNVKPIIAIATVGIAAIVILAVLFMSGVFTGGLSNPTVNIIPASDGPTGSLQSIATGSNVLTTPKSGYTAAYGYYMSGAKIGSISFANTGQEYYQGELCNKIDGSGTFDFGSYGGDSIEMSFDISGYETVSDSTLLYYDYDFNIDYSTYNVDMEGTVNIDRENGEITSTVYSSMTGSIETVMEVSDEYWTITNIQDNLYVGYSSEVTYTASVYEIDTDVTISISVIGQEDVTVTRGTYEDCYKVKIEQTSSGVTTTSYMWLNEYNVCPKMQISNSVAALGYGDFTIELEEYNTS